MKYYASISFGKDSLAMLLMLIEKKSPLDEVVFYDTGMEFQAIYDTRDRILPILSENGIKFTELHPKIPFLTKMFDIDVTSRDGSTHKGYSWCGAFGCRWGTTDKLNALKAYIGNNYDYVGIAVDEPKRAEKETRTNKLLPLFDWGITEAEALQYCYDHGFEWQENGIRLYDILDRVSCWCCGSKNNWELINIYNHLPKYWHRLEELQYRNRFPFRSNGDSIMDLRKKIESDALKFRR